MRRMSIAELVGAAQQLAATGQVAAAAALYRNWAEQSPDDPLLHAVHFNRGVLLSGINDLGGAMQAFLDAIRCNPGFLPPYVNLGAIHERLGDVPTALAHWQHVTNTLAGVTGDSLAYKTTAQKQIAQVLETSKRLREAEDTLRQIAELGSGQRDVIQHWMSLRQRQCTWPILQPLAGLDRRGLLRRMAPLTLANYTDDPLLALANAWTYSREDVGYPDAFQHWDPAAAAPAAGRRLRIGYLSSDLRDHAIGYLMADMFRLHDRGAFEITAYYNGIAHEDDTKRRIRGDVERWTVLTDLDDDQALRTILADGIDILVDVNGHTRSARSRLLSRRPAPVIVNWLGFPGTMGSPYHHYIIADDIIIPPGSEIFYSEAVRRLPCYQPNDRRRIAAYPPSRDALGLPADAVVYCSFNGTQKITPFGFARWMEVLRQVPGSVLWLLKSCEEIDVRLHELAASAGIAPERLIFAPLARNADHVARYAQADIFLDTSPYGAHTTASDALWMGVPVVTVPGRSFASRVCASLVRAAGLPELVCDSPEEYVQRAVALGHDPARRAAYRQRLLDGRHGSVLFDTELLVRSIEDLFRGMWQDHVAGRLPQPDLVNMEAYLDIGAALDHDAAEIGFAPGYEDRYRTALAQRHAYSPLPPDTRLWPRPATAG